jgi:hypothetical protein
MYVQYLNFAREVVYIYSCRGFDSNERDDWLNGKQTDFHKIDLCKINQISGINSTPFCLQTNADSHLRKVTIGIN